MPIPGWDDLIFGDILVVVKAVLLLDFMPGAGDHPVRPGHDVFFRLDATVDLEFLVNFCLAHPLVQETGQFGTAKGVAGIYERQTEDFGKLHGHIAASG